MFYKWYECFRMPLRILRMKRKHDAWVTNLHNTHSGCFSLSYISASLCPMSLFSFNFVLIVHIRPAFYGNVKTNASESLKTSCDHKNDLPTIRMICDWLLICCEYAFLANFRSMFLIVVTTQNRARMLYESLRMLGDHAAIIANWWRIAFVRSFVRYSLRCKSSISNPIKTKK